MDNTYTRAISALYISARPAFRFIEL